MPPDAALTYLEREGLLEGDFGSLVFKTFLFVFQMTKGSWMPLMTKGQEIFQLFKGNALNELEIEGERRKEYGAFYCALL